jgi:hypothetical protein
MDRLKKSLNYEGDDGLSAYQQSPNPWQQRLRAPRQQPINEKIE